MVIYFSGTGNSEYVAKRIAKETGEECINLFSRLRNRDYTQLASREPWVVVSPTYAWRLPRIMMEWLKKAVLTGNRRIYFVLTCGTDIGDAGRSLKALCAERDMEYMGCEGVVMPENYIAMFDVPQESEAVEIIKRAEKTIDDICFKIKTGKRLVGSRITLPDMIKSTAVNYVFYPVCVHSGKFETDDRCTGCGLCSENCVTGNIRIENGRPVWGRKCTHCMACICGCPHEAIEYGKKSRGKPRYNCPEEI